MAWTKITRVDYERHHGRYASDLTDREWALIAPFIPPEKTTGRPRTTCMRDVMVGLLVHSAGIQDRDGAPEVLKSIRHSYPWLRHVFADGGYAGPKLRGALKGIGDWTLEIVKRSGNPP